MSANLEQLLGSVEAQFREYEEVGPGEDWEVNLGLPDSAFVFNSDLQRFRGYVLGLADGLGISVADLLGKVTKTDGSTFLARKRGEAEDRVAQLRVDGARAFEADRQNRRSLVDAAISAEKRGVAAAAVDEALAKALEQHGVTADGPDAVAFASGWRQCLEDRVADTGS
jgi:hypothetical protein